MVKNIYIVRVRKFAKRGDETEAMLNTVYGILPTKYRVVSQ